MSLFLPKSQNFQSIADYLACNDLYKELIFQIITCSWGIWLRKLEYTLGCKDARVYNFTQKFSNKTIAIVWNAPNLDNQWEEIDWHDYVVRINEGWFNKNLNNDTGQKTNMHVIWWWKVMEKVLLMESSEIPKCDFLV